MHSMLYGMVNHLTRGGTSSLSRWSGYGRRVLGCVESIGRAVKNGRPAFSMMDLVHKNPRKLENFIHGMHPGAVLAAKLLMEHIDISQVGHMLDLGGGACTIPQIQNVVSRKSIPLWFTVDA